MSILTPFFSWFQTETIILNTYCTGLPSKTQNKFSMADMFSKKPSYLFKNTEHFVLYLLNERLGHLGVLKRGDGKLRNHVEKHRNVRLKPEYILSLIFPMSDIGEISASCFLHLNLKYWQTIFGIIWLKHYIFSFIMSKGAKTFCHLLFIFESTNNAYFSIYQVTKENCSIPSYLFPWMENIWIDFFPYQWVNYFFWQSTICNSACNKLNCTVDSRTCKRRKLGF